MSVNREKFEKWVLVRTLECSVGRATAPWRRPFKAPKLHVVMTKASFELTCKRQSEAC